VHFDQMMALLMQGEDRENCRGVSMQKMLAEASA
jgi:hypothetical protein